MNKTLFVIVILANKSFCLQKEMNIELQVERLIHVSASDRESSLNIERDYAFEFVEMFTAGNNIYIIQVTQTMCMNYIICEECFLFCGVQLLLK